jgi:hypothetical protein
VDSDLKQQEISSLRNRQSDDSKKAAADLSGRLFYNFNFAKFCFFANASAIKRSIEETN